MQPVSLATSFLSLIWMGLFSVLLSCSPPQQDSIPDDIQQYLAQQEGWQEEEGRINAAIEIVRRDQFVHDDLTINVLSPFVGMTQEYVRKLEDYQPKTQPVSNIHQQYIEGWRAHQFAIASLVDSAERQDYVQLATANRELMQAQRLVSTTVTNLARLAEQAGVIEPSSAEPSASSSSTPGEVLVK